METGMNFVHTFSRQNAHVQMKAPTLSRLTVVGTEPAVLRMGMPSFTGRHGGIRVCLGNHIISLSNSQLTAFCLVLIYGRMGLHGGRIRGGLQTLELRMFEPMESSANSDGRIDASGTTLYLSRTRQGISTISNERPYWLTQQL
jgi:hypothetical protein